MKRSLADIRENLDHVGCDNETAREMCDHIDALEARLAGQNTTFRIGLRSANDRAHQMRARAERAEAALAEARKALEQARETAKLDDLPAWVEFFDAALARQNRGKE